MNKAIFRITLDMGMIESQYQIPAKLHDTSRSIHMDLCTHGAHYEIESGSYARVIYKDSSGIAYVNDCTISMPGSIVVFDFPSKGFTDEERLVECELRLYGSDGEIITSPRFTVLVSNVIYDDGGQHGITISSIIGLQEYIYQDRTTAEAALSTSNKAVDKADSAISTANDAKALATTHTEQIEEIKAIEEALEINVDVEHSIGEGYMAGAITFSNGDTFETTSFGKLIDILTRVKRLEEAVFNN